MDKNLLGNGRGRTPSMARKAALLILFQFGGKSKRGRGEVVLPYRLVFRGVPLTHRGTPHPLAKMTGSGAAVCCGIVNGRKIRAAYIKRASAEVRGAGSSRRRQNVFQGLCQSSLAPHYEGGGVRGYPPDGVLVTLPPRAK